MSIKMAKTQNLSLNPTKISGTCGRLMCCLKYEQNAYEDLMKGAPKADSFVETPDGAGTINSVNTLREQVRVRLDSAPDSLKTYHNSEIRVIRSGKGKRPEGYVEPPREELAKLRRVTESPEDQFRREQAALAAALDEFMSEHQEEPAHGERGGSSRRRRGDRGRNAEKAERALEAEVEKEKEKQHRRSRHHRGSRSQNLQGQGDPQSLAALAEEAMEHQEETPSRRRSSRGRGRNRSAAPRQEKPNREASAQKSGEGGEKKSRPRWHRRSHRRPGGGGQGGATPPAQG